MSASTATRRWADFGPQWDERGREYIEVDDRLDASHLLRFGASGVPRLRVLSSAEAPADIEDPRPGTDASSWASPTAAAITPEMVTALLRELEARTRQIDVLLARLPSVGDGTDRRDDTEPGSRSER